MTDTPRKPDFPVSSSFQSTFRGELCPDAAPNMPEVAARRGAWLDGGAICQEPVHAGTIWTPPPIIENIQKILRVIPYDNLVGYQPPRRFGTHEALGDNRATFDALGETLRALAVEDARRGGMENPIADVVIRGGDYRLDLQHCSADPSRWHVDNPVQEEDTSELQLRYVTTLMGDPTHFAVGNFSRRMLQDTYYLPDDTPVAGTKIVSFPLGAVVRFEQIPHIAPPPSRDVRLFGAAVVQDIPREC